MASLGSEPTPKGQLYCTLKGWGLKARGELGGAAVSANWFLTLWVKQGSACWRLGCIQGTGLQGPWLILLDVWSRAQSDKRTEE